MHIVCALVLWGLILESFRLSVAAGAIQAELSKGKMILLGGIFAAVQLVLFCLGKGLFLCFWECMGMAGNSALGMKHGSVLFFLLVCVYIRLGIQEKTLEESCICPWTVEGFTKYTLKHGLIFLCVGGASAYCWHGNFVYEGVIWLSLFMAAVVGLAYGYWQGVKGWQKLRLMTGCIWFLSVICFWNL